MKRNDLFSNGADWETDEQMCRVRCGSGIIADVHATIEDKDYGEAMNANMRLIKEAPFMFNLLRSIELFACHYSDEELLKYIRKEVVPQIWKMRIRSALTPATKRLAAKKKQKESETMVLKERVEDGD